MVEQTTADPEFEGSNLANGKHQGKMAEKHELLPFSENLSKHDFIT